jgi:hypothetical protein
MDLRKYGFTTSDAPDKKKKNESETKEKKKEGQPFYKIYLSDVSFQWYRTIGQTVMSSPVCNG